MSWGKVPGKTFEPQAQELSMQGNHDNPVSGNHQTSSHQKKVQNWYLPHTYHREGGREGREWGRQAQLKRAKHTRAEVDLNSCALKPRHHLQNSQPLCMPATEEATDQLSFAFNLA